MLNLKIEKFPILLFLILMFSQEVVFAAGIEDVDAFSGRFGSASCSQNGNCDFDTDDDQDTDGLDLYGFILGLKQVAYRTYLPNQLPLDGQGWTIINPSSDSRVIYVSYSEGEDDHDGLSEATPKKTIEAANALMRDGYPDHMLLKRGDTWPDFAGLGRWKNGRSASEPIVISYYGESGDRPVIKTIDYFLNPNGYEFNYQAFIGLDLYNSRHDPDSPDFDDGNYSAGIRLIGGGKDILFEDCRMRFMQISSSTYTWANHEDNLVTNFKLRRCIVTDSWAHNTTDSHSARPQGYYASETHGILVEACVFDHNGWSEAFADANANMYNHNIYLAISNHGPIVIRGNILSRGSAHGLQLRSGGLAENNLFYGNAIGMNAGYTEYPAYNTENTYVRNNVVIAGRPQIPNDFSNPQSGALWGIWKQLIDNYYCHNNIVCNINDTRAGNINPYVGQTANEYGTGNIAWNWVNNNDPESDPGWVDPDRTVASFNASLGNPETFEDFIQRARSRSVHTWPEEYSANSVNHYIRTGFAEAGNRAPEVSFNYSTPSQTPATVQFTSSVSDPDGDALNYAWIFQDAIFDVEGDRALIDKGYSSQINSSYTFNNPGTYTVSLTVGDNRGGLTTVSEKITIDGNNPPVASVELDQTSGDAPLTIEFDASESFDPDGDSLTYVFDFGDGNISSTDNAMVTHTYGPGDSAYSTYTYSFYVSDGAAESLEKKGTISVKDPAKEVSNYPVEADALLDANDPDTNFGTVINSLVTQDDRHGIFRFNYSSNTGTILKAELYIPVKHGSNPCAVKYIADDSWGETSVTWNNQPASQEALATAVYEDGWAVFDITDKVAAETDGVISILLYETAQGWQEFRYRETGWVEAYLQLEVQQM